MNTVIALKTASFHTGIVHASMESHSVTVVVLPKSWKPAKWRGTQKYSQRTYIWPSKEKEGVLCLYENEHVDLFIMDPLDPSNPQYKQDQYDDVLRIRRKLLSDLLHASTNSRQETSDTEVKDTNLISLGVPSRRQYDPQALLASDLDTAIPKIIGLYMLLNISGYSQLFHRRLALQHDRLLLPLLHLQFMQEMLKAYRRLHKEYIPQAEKLRMIRGRVSTLSLAKIEETEEQVVLCHYDELGNGTPIVRVLLSALDIVSRGHALSQKSSNSSQEYVHIGNTANRGKQIRRFFQSIPSYPLQKALNISSNIRITQRTKHLQPLLSMAQLILRQKQAVLKQRNTQRMSMWCWEVDMSDVWEFLLFKGYQQINSVRVMYYDKSLGDCSVYPKKSIPAAFGNEQKKNSNPDLLLTAGTDNWIVDAKYSYYHSSLPANASIAYRDQMFRYLFLTSKEQAENQNTTSENQEASTPWAQHLALVYTTDQAEALCDDGQEVQSIWLDSWGKNRPKLYQCAVKFPSPKEVMSMKTWKGYSQMLTAQLQQTLGLS